MCRPLLRGFLHKNNNAESFCGNKKIWKVDVFSLPFPRKIDSTILMVIKGYIYGSNTKTEVKNY